MDPRTKDPSNFQSPKVPAWIRQRYRSRELYNASCRRRVQQSRERRRVEPFPDCSQPELPFGLMQEAA